MKVQISAVIITYNEERNIGRCLESLVGVADEIVVVDSYSTDRTEEICRSYNALFIKHRFSGYMEQKNWANLQARFPYILSVDADEALSDELRISIIRTKENWTHEGYYFNRLTNYCGKWIRHTSWYPSRKLRLWDARTGSWGGLDIHEKFFLRKGARRKFLKGDLLHYSYYSVSDHVTQMNKYSTILARSYYENGRRAWFISLIVHPIWRLFRDLILRAGFLDGYYGFIVSANSAYEVFLKYLKLRNLCTLEKRNQRRTVCLFNSMNSWGGGEKWHFDVASYLVEQRYRTILVSSHGSQLSTRVNELDIPAYRINISNLSFMNPLKMWRLVRIFRREKVGVLITNLSGDMKIASLAGKIAGIPNIIYRRGSAIPVRNTLLNRYLYRRVITGILANSMETKRTILANNALLVPENKIRVIYNGVYLPRYHKDIQPIYRAGNDEIVLGSAGRLSEEKGHMFLLEMMQLLNSGPKSYRLLIAGEGRLYHSLKKKARKLGIEDRVEFLGFVENMPAFFKSLDVFLLSSHYEGFGYVIAEAMASSKPVVAFDIRSSAEIIENGKTGYITDENSAGELARRVAELAGNPSLREEMGRNGRIRVEKMFSLEKTRVDILEMIDLTRE